MDAKDGFNLQSRLTCLWTTRHLWPRGCRFAFNCYTHQAQCFIRSMVATPIILLSREGLRRGVQRPCYSWTWHCSTGQAVLKEERELACACATCTCDEQWSHVMPWYEDDANQQAESLLKYGPGFGSFQSWRRAGSSVMQRMKPQPRRSLTAKG